MLYLDLIRSINVYYYYCGHKLNCNNSTSSRNMHHRVFVFFGSRILVSVKLFIYICLCTLCTCTDKNHSFSWETECDKATSTSPLTQPTLDDAYLSHTCRAHFCIKQRSSSEISRRIFLVLL